MGNELGRQLCLGDGLLHRAEPVDRVRAHRPQMLARDSVGRRIGPFVGMKFWKTEFFHCSAEANGNAGAFQFRVILDAGPKLAQACQHLFASIPDAGDETETGDDNASLGLRILGRHKNLSSLRKESGNPARISRHGGFVDFSESLRQKFVNVIERLHPPQLRVLDGNVECVLHIKHHFEHHERVHS